MAAKNVNKHGRHKMAEVFHISRLKKFMSTINMKVSPNELN